VKILIDTNVIVDVALEREPYLVDSEQVLLFVEQDEVEGYISASTFSDLYYIIRRQKSREWTFDFLSRLVTYCEIATVNEAAIRMALTANFRDLEDAIQYATAAVNELEAIVTRNPDDFPVTTPRIMTPNQLIQGLTNSP
jgi:predicted nucleic acid-binding protein